MNVLKKQIVLSGMRPTGALHLGHYVGVISNWIKLQDDPTKECFIFLADWHALTSNYDNIDVIKKSRFEYVRGWLASGLDPKKCYIYQQSLLPEIMYLFQVLLCLTPPGWADRSPSWKDLTTNPNARLDNLGFYTYPILQAADIAIVNGELVPVGEDQLSHLEISREIVRKLNRFYQSNVPEPQALLTEIPKLLGTDGRKMSSSIGNVISLQETEKSLQKKINKMKTDDTRLSIENNGNPDNCSVYDYHKVFSDKATCDKVNFACRKAELGCGECKQILGGFMKELFIPISDRMGKISDEECQSVIDEGTKRVRPIIEKNWQEISKQIKFF